jgi:hypothetical protein
MSNTAVKCVTCEGVRGVFQRAATEEIERRISTARLHARRSGDDYAADRLKQAVAVSPEAISFVVDELMTYPSPPRQDYIERAIMRFNLRKGGVI